MHSKEFANVQSKAVSASSMQVCAHKRQKGLIMRQQQSRRSLDCLSLVNFHRFEPSLLLDSACVTICIIPDDPPCDCVNCYCTPGMKAMVHNKANASLLNLCVNI